MVMAIALFVTGCGDSGSSGGATKAGAKETISADGSTSMEKVIGLLSEAYMEKDKNLKITYNPTGSSAGIQAVMDGRADIGLSSRDLKAAEKEKLNAVVVAHDAIAVVVNPANKVKDLSVELLAKVYRGEIKNWKELGGDDAPIVLVGREAASGTRDGFESITKTKDKTKYTQELTSTGDVIQTVASNPNAIGYASLGTIKSTAKLVTIDGVMPSVEIVQDKSYKIQRDFLLVTAKNKEAKKGVQAFLAFVTDKANKALLIKAGAIPTN